MSAVFDLDYYRFRLAALAARGVYVGTSSWNYPGWLGMIYTESRYLTRGRFSKAKFEENCLREYAETFKSVCFDGAYYTFYGEDKWRALADQVPPDFKFGLKVPEAITVKRWPGVERYGARGGQLNGDFLNAGLFIERFLQPMEAVRTQIGPIMLEFSKFHASEYSSGGQFIDDLDRFLGAIPKGWNYSVELRNRKWLGPEYLACLQRHDVAHVYNNWTDMPPVSEQLEIVGDARTERSTVARFLLKSGRKYEEAVARFQPYTKTHEINEEGRAALAAMMDRGWLKLSKDGTYVYINNRLEGNALLTVLAVLERLTQLPPPPPPSEAKASLARRPPSPTAEPQLDLGLDA